ncbi:hypothetical protein CBP36_02420 [Acidovorax carolinensis]|uniref:Phosphonate ABC transporter substrate-binding protein n=1 Tax=Acidovorax carolinensis TaxID=553814 RepID=A0A240UA01_9BURK|nr:hypothetical protein CBP35_16520 [Acidovorax carolinensis]ART57860.1 hypothetical protein CBP36_02420 [Acidovorax carolinensis]
MIKKLCAALALGLGMTGAMAQDINFGIISTEATQNLKADWQPLLDDMARQTGFKIEWHLLWIPVVTMHLDFPASMGTRDL